jgi:hypothetical protein
MHPPAPSRPTRRPWKRLALAALAGAAAAASAAAQPPGTGGWGISVRPSATPLERFAARELQRYVYARTGELLPIAPREGGPAPPGFLVAAGGGGPAAPMAAQEYRLVCEAGAGGQRISIIGGDAVGTLYGVYRFAERMGVRFYLHGDVIPDARIPLSFAPFSEEGRPLFGVRGLQPFHDFAEGPDWWGTDDYMAVIGQLAKLRMNFIGLHTYPDGSVGPEPTVWIGLGGQYDGRGQVSAAYPASYHTTGRSGRTWWTYAPLRTSDFAGGAADLYERDDFGSEVMRDQGFAGQTPEGSAAVFNRTAAMLGTAFAEARRLGILTCVGTETPLTLPGPVRDELRRRGRDPADPDVAREVYRAIFGRMGLACPADYYWLWTPEDWTWEGNAQASFKAASDDVVAALGALDDLHSPMRLATCGWVLGPQQDRAAMDRLLPLSSPMSTINAAVGYGAIERQFANLSDRPRWAIPWLENDGDLTSPELWAGRMRYDAADALRLGCTGLIGIHWRTRILAPAISALAAAAWEQPWVPADFDTSRIPPQTASGADGGHPVVAAGPGLSPPFSTNRVGMGRYDLLIPNGTYHVKLGFCELEETRHGRRVFNVTLQGARIADRMDLAVKYGPRRPVTLEYAGVKVTNGHLLVEFDAVGGQPAIAAIEVEGTTGVGDAGYSRRISCGGPAWGDFEADQLPGRPRPPEDRAMPVGDLYRDFCRANFGPEAADAIAGVFASVDGTRLPVPSYWFDGPGDIRPNDEPWERVSADYRFVGEFEALRARVMGAANLDRYDYWLCQFRSMRLIAEIGCAVGALDREMAAIARTANPKKEASEAGAAALALRLRLAGLWTELLRTEVAGASSSGELGTIANLEQRSRVHQGILSRHDRELARLLGCDLPLESTPSRAYAGPLRIIVPAVRTSAGAREALRLRVIVAAEQDPASVTLFWRPMGGSEYRREELARLGRHVYQADLPAMEASNPAVEYHIEARVGGDAARWPASDIGLDQTVILGSEG